MPGHTRSFITIAGTVVDLALDARQVIDVQPATTQGLDGCVDLEALGWSAASSDEVPARVLLVRAHRQVTALLARGAVGMRELEAEALCALPLEALRGGARALTEVVFTGGARPLLVLAPELLLQVLVG